ncbi:DUF4244 domain-containing protein [Nocardia sp. NBC_01327]|nr:DUF4244 domain-containing protein [Nocardia sp. NBC_01327]
MRIGRIGVRRGEIVRSSVRSLSWGLRERLLLVAAGEEGMSTAEYAIGTIAAAAFGAVLYAVVTGDSVVNALTKIIDRALKTSTG